MVRPLRHLGRVQHERADGVVTGEIMPSSSTGTISIGMPHSAQSMMLQIGSSPQRSGVFGQQVKMAIGLLTQIVAAARGIAHDLAHARHAPGREGARRPPAGLECESTRYSRQPSAMSWGMSLGMKAVER